jgi:hypothetical protein
MRESHAVLDCRSELLEESMFIGAMHSHAYWCQLVQRYLHGGVFYGGDAVEHQC